MKDLRKNVLELYDTGLKAKAISEKINVEYSIVTKILKNEQRRIRRAKNPEPYRKSANARYPKYAKKAIARASKRYEEKKDEISAKTKEDRKINPEKYRLKRQKEKAKDPEGFKRAKNANWTKNYPKNKSRLNKKVILGRKKRKQQVFTHYSKKLSNSDIPCCNCCRYVGIEFLTVDHIIPKNEMAKDPKWIEMKFRATRKADPLCQWLITNDFPKGFQILCWNCNFAKGVLGQCSHQIKK